MKRRMEKWHLDEDVHRCFTWYRMTIPYLHYSHCVDDDEFQFVITPFCGCYSSCYKLGDVNFCTNVPLEILQEFLNNEYKSSKSVTGMFLNLENCIDRL